MSVYWARGSEKSYGFFDATSSIIYTPGHGFSVDAVIKHELVHAKITDMSSLGFVERALRFAAVASAARQDWSTHKALERKRKNIVTLSSHVHEVAAWYLTDTMRLMEPRLHRFNGKFPQVRIPQAPAQYVQDISKLQHIYLIAGMREQNSDGSIPPIVHPMNFTHLAQFMAIWALSPPIVQSYLAGVNLDDSGDLKDMVEILVADPKQNPRIRFESLMNWATEIRSPTVEDLIYRANRGELFAVAPIDVAQPPLDEGKIWDLLLTHLDPNFLDPFRSYSDHEKSMHRFLGGFIPSLDPYPQVTVLQPEKYMEAPSPTAVALLDKLKSKMILQVQRHSSMLDFGHPQDRAGALEPELMFVSVYNVSAGVANGYKLSVSDFRSLVQKLDPKRTLITVGSLGYDFDGLDFPGHPLSGLPHVVVAPMAFRELWQRITWSGGIGGNANLEYLLVPSRYPEEYSLLAIKGRGPSQSAIITAVPHSPERVLSFADRRGDEPDGWPTLTRVYSRLVDWAPELAATITASWCIWEHWLQFREFKPEHEVKAQ